MGFQYLGWSRGDDLTLYMSGGAVEYSRDKLREAYESGLAHALEGVTANV